MGSGSCGSSRRVGARMNTLIWNINAYHLEMQAHFCRCVTNNDLKKKSFCTWGFENGNRKTRPALSRCPTRSAPVSDTVDYFSPVSSKLCGSTVGYPNLCKTVPWMFHALAEEKLTTVKWLMIALVRMVGKVMARLLGSIQPLHHSLRITCPAPFLNQVNEAFC